MVLSREQEEVMRRLMAMGVELEKAKAFACAAGVVHLIEARQMLTRIERLQLELSGLVERHLPQENDDDAEVDGSTVHIEVEL